MNRSLSQKDDVAEGLAQGEREAKQVVAMFRVDIAVTLFGLGASEEGTQKEF